MSILIRYPFLTINMLASAGEDILKGGVNAAPLTPDWVTSVVILVLTFFNPLASSLSLARSKDCWSTILTPASSMARYRSAVLITTPSGLTIGLPTPSSPLVTTPCSFISWNSLTMLPSKSLTLGELPLVE